MSPRTLLRQFRDVTGLPPGEWIVRERVAAAREMLESGRMPIGRVAEQAGFGSHESFRRHFRLLIGASPAAYRRRFLRSPA
jgi:AraC family transcriptional activator FtrA